MHTIRVNVPVVISVVFALLVSPLLTTFVTEYARELGAFDHPSATIAALLAMASAIGNNRWFLLAVAVAFGGTLFMWIDYFMRRAGFAGRGRAPLIPAETRKQSAVQSPSTGTLPQSVDVLKQHPPDFNLWRTVTTARISEIAAICVGDDPNLSLLSSAAGPYRRHIFDGVREGKIRRVDERKKIQTRAILDEGDPGEWAYIDAPVSELSEVFVDDVRRYFAAKGVRTPLFNE